MSNVVIPFSAAYSSLINDDGRHVVMQRAELKCEILKFANDEGSGVRDESDPVTERRTVKNIKEINFS